MGDAAESVTGEISPLEEKIIQQIEYYFGDLNLPKDKFLQGELKKDDGWITLETLSKFNRLKSLSTDSAFIAAALRKSKNGLVEVDEECKKVRRLKPLPENSLEYWQDVKSRTVYVKRFPETITLDMLQEFFKKFGNVERVFMRYYKSDQQRNFKGSVFVTFPSREEAKKFVDIESVKHGEEELVRLLQEHYFKAKNEESRRKREERKHAQRNGEESKTDQEAPHFTPGRVIRLTGIPKEKMTLDGIRGLFTGHQNPEWVDFEKGNDEAFVRFENQANSAEDVLKRTLEAVGGKLTLGETDITTEVITGDVESQYWERTQKAIKEAREQKSGGRGRGRGRGGRGGGRGSRGRGRGGGGRGQGRGHVSKEEAQAAQNEEADVKPKNTKKRFSSSSESDAEEKAEKELRTPKRPAPATEEGTEQKKAKIEKTEPQDP